MSIFNFLEKLRKKSEVERRRILVGSTFAITAIIFFVWVSLRFYGFENIENKVVKKEEGPLKEAFEIFGKFSKNISESVASIKSILNSSSTVATTTESNVFLESE